MRTVPLLAASVLVLTLGAARAGAQAPPPEPKDKSVKGSGTPGNLALWTGPEFLGSSVVFETNGNIGIGTITPGSKLTVIGRIEANASGPGASLLGQSDTGSAVRGASTSGAGVFGSSQSNQGVLGISDTFAGVFGFSQNGSGVQGGSGSSANWGVRGDNSAAGGTGVLGQAPFGTGVRGISSTGFGVWGTSTTFTGVEARSNTGFGLFAESETNIGMYGRAIGHDAMVGESRAPGRSGAFGFNTNAAGFGVFGSNIATGTSGYLGGDVGAAGFSATGIAVRGSTTTGVAGAFFGPVYVNHGNASWAITATGLIESTNGGFRFPDGTIQTTAAGGTSRAFRIDHPLDPANKYLSHSSVESPDMMNIYNGVVVLDASGQAIVDLPAWFEALNADYRYQLTAIGAAAPHLHVAREVANNQFAIAGGAAFMKVSWQVTGVRRDPWALEHRVKVEEDKPKIRP